LLFLVVCLVAAGWLWQHKGDQVEVLAVRTAVPAGATLDRFNLVTSSVSGVTGAIPAADADRVVGRVAATGLVPGQVLLDELVTDVPVPSAAERMVGLQLDPTRVPDGLAPGDVVTVVAVPPPGDASGSGQLARPTVLTEAATVHAAAGTQDGGSRLSLLVPQDAANQVAAFGAAGRVAVVQAPAPGVGVDGADGAGGGG
jgi:hypothetical protein